MITFHCFFNSIKISDLFIKLLIYQIVYRVSNYYVKGKYREVRRADFLQTAGEAACDGSRVLQKSRSKTWMMIASEIESHS